MRANIEVLLCIKGEVFNGKLELGIWNTGNSLMITYINSGINDLNRDLKNSLEIFPCHFFFVK